MPLVQTIVTNRDVGSEALARAIEADIRESIGVPSGSSVHVRDVDGFFAQSGLPEPFLALTCGADRVSIRWTVQSRGGVGWQVPSVSEASVSTYISTGLIDELLAYASTFERKL